MVADSRNTFSKKVVASPSYIDKHLRFLECASDRRFRDNSNANSHEIIVQNVNRLLFHQLQCRKSKKNYIICTFLLKYNANEFVKKNYRIRANSRVLQ